jgi:hypothetical protein
MQRTPSTDPLAKHSLFLKGLLVFLVCLAGLAAIQAATPNLVGHDGYYHIKMAYLMRTEGLKPDFVWLPLSVLNPQEYVDHHFLFHVLMIPFTFGDLVLGAKLASMIFPALAFLAFWLLLERQKVPMAWLWTFGLLAVSEAFLYRMSMPRAQSLSLGVLMLGLNFVLARKRRALFFLAWAYVWLYNAFPLLVLLAGAYSLARWLVERDLDWRTSGSALAGIAAGLVVNPYFPRNLVFVARHILPKLSGATEISVGNEWFPYTTGQLLENSWASFAILALGLICLALSKQAVSARTMTALLLMGGFGLMLMQARRFIEYFPAFVLAFSAFNVADWQAQRQPAADSSSVRISWARLAGLAAVAAAAWWSIGATRTAVSSSEPYTRYAAAAAWLQQNTPQGALVFQTDWDDFPELFFYNHHNTYLAGLDPTYMALYDEELYAMWVALTRGQVGNPGQIIAATFGARYVISDQGHGAFIDEAMADPRMRLVFEDESAVIFEVLAE